MSRSGPGSPWQIFVMNEKAFKESTILSLRMMFGLRKRWFKPEAAKGILQGHFGA